MSVYMDAAATSKPYQEVIDAMMPYLTEQYFNPSSLYSNGVKVKNAIDDARKTVGDFINADANEIYFTSGGSESNCWAIRGFVDEVLNRNGKPMIITSKIEHKSILECVKFLDGLYTDVRYVGVDDKCFIDCKKLIYTIERAVDRGIRPKNILVSLQLANNECGSIQDIKKISGIVHSYGCTLHVDAVQAFGQIKIDVKDMGIDMLSASAHKIGACKGTGILYKSDKTNIKPLIFGSQMNGMRGGTENVAGIVGMAKAVEIAKDSIRHSSELSNKRDYLIMMLRHMGCHLNGAVLSNRLPNNVNVILPNGVGAEEMLYMLDLSDIMVSTGSACNSRMKKPSHVLIAMGLTDDEAARSIRLTLNRDITYDDIDECVNEISNAIKLINSVG